MLGITATTAIRITTRSTKITAISKEIKARATTGFVIMARVKARTTPARARAKVTKIRSESPDLVKI